MFQQNWKVFYYERSVLVAFLYEFFCSWMFPLFNLKTLKLTEYFPQFLCLQDFYPPMSFSIWKAYCFVKICLKLKKNVFVWFPNVQCYLQWVLGADGQDLVLEVAELTAPGAPFAYPSDETRLVSAAHRAVAATGTQQLPLQETQKNPKRFSDCPYNEKAGLLLEVWKSQKETFIFKLRKYKIWSLVTTSHCSEFNIFSIEWSDLCEWFNDIQIIRSANKIWNNQLQLPVLAKMYCKY